MPEAFEREVHCLLGLPFDAVDMAGAMRRVRRAAATRTPLFLSTPNLNFVVAARRDPDFRDSVVNSDLSVADGMPLVWVARLLGLPIKERVAGSNLFERLRAERDQRLSVYFFGGPDGAGEAAQRRLNENPGGLYCVGYASPGFGSLEDMSRGELLTRINASHADFLVVALGAKKGQAWIERNRPYLHTPVVSHLGAVINHSAGSVRRAPPWMQKAGLEWLWRIAEEPALWRRYANDGLAFAGLLFGKVLPLAWMNRRRPGQAEFKDATLAAQSGLDRSVLTLTGPWGRENISRLRARLDDRLLSGRDLYLDLQDVSWVDSAFLGLLMLVYGHQKRQGRRFMVSALRPPVRRSFGYHCAEFLLEDRARYGRPA